MKHLLPLSLLSLLLVFSCSRPPSDEYFVLQKDSDHGIYPFTLDMSDSTYTYDISFYTKVDGKKTTGMLPLQVMLTSPSGVQYSEQVYMREGDIFGDRHPYRSGLTPVEYGSWSLCIAALNDLKGMRGMGVILERKKKDGTR